MKPLLKKAEAKEKLTGLSLRVVLTVGIFLAALAIFAAIADEMVLEHENHFDTVVFNWIAPMINPTTTSVMMAITFFGSSPFLFPAYLVLILFFLFWKKDRRLSLEIASVAIAGTVLLFSLKTVFHRHRPPNRLIHAVNSFSFPSGHAFSSFTFFGLLIYLLWKKKSISSVLRWSLTILFFLAACAISFSRVYLHVHYPSDVIGGFCLCLVWLGTTFWIFQTLRKKQM
ncbi:MAG TPA: phosphatase PAP2 family protein [Flavisolibacter sp.]|nr:phosphatase PAP2 family protein [Flavisolibacter sp.]